MQRNTGSGKIDLLPNRTLFSKVTGTSIPLQEFMHFISHWNKKITEEQIAFLNLIIGLLNMAEVKNKMLKRMIEEQSFKNAKKRWFKTSPR